MAAVTGRRFGNTGAILNYVAGAMSNSAAQLDSMTGDNNFGARRFGESSSAGNENVVLPHGSMIAKRILIDDGFIIFHEDCRRVSVDQEQSVLRCPPCVNHRKLGNQFINQTFCQVFAPFSQRANLRYVVDQPIQAVQK